MAASCAVPAVSPGQDEVSGLMVCAKPEVAHTCDYIGMAGLQKAVDEAIPGALIHLREGRYMASAYRDVPFQDLVVRGALVIEGKELSLIGEPGAVLAGSEDYPVSAIVINDSTVKISGLGISDFTYLEPEDDIYDGHGIFTIASNVELDSVRIAGVDKMAVTGRETGHVTARNLTIAQSHLGVWLEETAHLNLTESLITGSESAAIAAYMEATVQVSGSLIEGNQDDGLYTEDNAYIRSADTDIVSNSPYGARAAGHSQILLCGGEMTGNDADTGEEDAGRVLLGDAQACSGR